MLYIVNKQQYEVPVERVHAGLTVYDTWLRGLGRRPIDRRERVNKVEAIAALLAPRQYVENGELKTDYYAPTRLFKVLLSEIGKRAKGRVKPRESLPLFGS